MLLLCKRDAFCILPTLHMENLTDDGVLTRDVIANLFATDQLKHVASIDEYAAALRMQIEVRRAELKRIRSQRSTILGRFIRLIRWALKPWKMKFISVPELGLHSALVGIHVAIGIGHLLFNFQG